IAVPVESRLQSALSKRFQGPPPYSILYGPSLNMAVSADPEKAKQAGWERYFTGQAAKGDTIRQSLFARSLGVLSPALSKKTALIIGLGSGGSYVAEQLVRSGVGKIILIDGENVEPENLCRTGYLIGDVGSSKVAAMTRRLLNINPELNVIPNPRHLADVGKEMLTEYVTTSDIILPLTDDNYAQARINHYAYYYKTPAIFAALHRGAKVGELILAIPGVTPCLECATAGVRSSNSKIQPDQDYGTSRLMGEVALGADIHHLDSATVKMSLSLLLRDHPELQVSQFVKTAIEKDFTSMYISMAPTDWAFPTVFANTQAQYMYQSFWTTSKGLNPDCQFCGTNTQCEDPNQFALSPDGVKVF
ncbi:MAG: ThiF family adenylyltransferase, partial [Lentisphaerota bacterium]